MPRFYCDYCDTYLTHDSQAGRLQHVRGWKHRENLKLYYEQFLLPQQPGPSMIPGAWLRPGAPGGLPMGVPMMGGGPRPPLARGPPPFARPPVGGRGPPPPRPPFIGGPSPRGFIPRGPPPPFRGPPGGHGMGPPPPRPRGPVAGHYGPG